MNPETFQKQYPIALAALGEHMVTHQLPAPHSIDITNQFRDGRVVQAIRVYLPAETTHQAWLDSVVVDALSEEPSATGLGVRREWSVRLPESGIRFQFVGFVSRVLQAVSA